MVLRRGNKKRRAGLQAGPERHKITFSTEEKRRSDFLGISTTRISKWAYGCCSLILKFSCATCIVPFEYSGGRLYKAPRWKFGIHYLIDVVVILSMTHKVIVFNKLVSSHGLSFHALISLVYLVPYMCIPSLGGGNYFRLQETINLINSWDGVMDCFSRVTGRRLGYFDDIAVAIKVIGIACILAWLPLSAVLTLAFREHPVTLHGTLLNLGVGSSLPILLLQLLCIPLECMLALTAFSAGVGGITLVIGIGVLKVIHLRMRAMSETNAEEISQLQRMYIWGQVYNKVLDVWYKFVVPPSFFVGGTVVVLTLYVSIRHTDLPLWLYSLFPYIAVLFSVIMFNLCYEGMVVIRTSEDILGTLKSKEKLHSIRMPAERRLEMMKRSRALRLAYFSVGEFTEFNLDVPAGVWDEILNQLMFLLTL